MAKTPLRSLVVDGEQYLWRVLDYYDVYDGKLIIYSADHKAGWLEVHFTTEDRVNIYPQGAVFAWTGESGLPFIQQPLIAVRVIRFARRQLNWMPKKNAPPHIIEDGYELFKAMGYEPVP